MKCCYYIDMLLLQGGMTALHYACRYGHIEVVKHLISNKADISATDKVSDYVVCLLYNCLWVSRWLINQQNI